MDKRLKQWLKDRDLVALSGKYDDYEKFCKKYKIPQAPNTKVFEIMIHKMRANITTIPKDIQEESKIWLLDNGYRPY